MNSARFINSILKNEKNIFLIKKRSETGIFDNTIFGLINLLLNRDKDYFLITNKRIIFLVKNKLILNSEYNDLSKIKFNSNNDTLWFLNNENNNNKINLRNLRLTYEEIQKINKQLNQ